MASAKTTSAIFSEIFERQIIPLLQTEGLRRIIVARPELNKTHLPLGVQATRKQMRGQRVISHGPGGNISARWPQDGLHAHRILNLTFVVAGQIDFPCGKYALHCGEGFWILLPPGTPGSDGSHSFLEGDRLKNGVCDTLSLSPRGRGVHLWMRHSRGTEYRLLSGENIFIPSGQASQFLNVIQEEIAAARPHWPQVCLASLQAMCFVLKRELEIGRFLLISGGIREEETPGDDYNSIVQAQNYIKTHLNEHLTMEKVARSVHLSRAQFARLFRAETGQTFTAWTNGQRLEEAKKFLRDTEWSIPAVSSFVGFLSASYFHTLFRQSTGMTPQKFRACSREGQSTPPEDFAMEKRDDTAENETIPKFKKDKYKV